MQKIKKWFKNIVDYLKAVKNEAKRITWPTKKELQTATIVVIITLIVVTTYMYVVDTVIFVQIFKVLRYYF